MTIFEMELAKAVVLVVVQLLIKATLLLSPLVHNQQLLVPIRVVILVVDHKELVVTALVLAAVAQAQKVGQSEIVTMVIWLTLQGAVVTVVLVPSLTSQISQIPLWNIAVVVGVGLTQTSTQLLLVEAEIQVVALLVKGAPTEI
jgi:hypothetical protein